MAEPGRTVRVSGLPTDIDDDRLRDKLFIHFLRARNGGGEIASVSFVKATPACALITFEDSGVAQRVIQRGRHILEVDGKKYKVSVAEHCESLDPDEVVLSLSATVDYSRLPGGMMTLTSLHKSHPDIQINYDTTETLCTLQGAYSKVQAAFAQLLGPENKDSGQPAGSGSRSAQVAHKPHTQASEDQSRKPNKQREQREAHIGRPSDESNSGSYKDVTPGGDSWEDTGQTAGAALQLPEHPATSEEDFSLIVDADMFQYLQKHCREEYQRILRQYGVDVVDMTNQGLTTLFLQNATEVGEDGRDRERLELARKALSGLYQENETKIRRAQLLKSILSPREGLQRALEILRIRYPKLLLNEDDRYIYIIGSSSDVSEAKQFLLLDLSEMRGDKEDAGLRFPSYDSSSSTHADEQRVPLVTPSAVDPLDDGMGPLLRSEEDERRAEGAKRYKLAARFKDSGLAALSSRPTDLTVRGLSSPSRQTHLGPKLGHDALSETAGIESERVSRALPQNTGGDILFKSGDASPSAASLQRTTMNSQLVDKRPKSVASPLSTTQPSLSGSTPLPPAGSGSTLKRASSFSGTPQQKAQVMGRKSQDDSSKSTVRARARSSSFSNQTGRDKQEVFDAEITVSTVMWHHIKEAYGTRVDDLTSDVQMKESRSEGGRTVTIRGANSSKVSSCQQGLQRLIDSVGVDFSVQELRLSELGIADQADETLQACCAEVCSRFKSVTIKILENSVFVLGPERLCSQVGATLQEVFCGAQTPEQPGPSTSKWNPPASTMSEDLHYYSNRQVLRESQTSREDWTGGSQDRTTNHRSDFHESELVNGFSGQLLARRDPVIKEKVKAVATVEMDGQKTRDSTSKTGSESRAGHVNGVGSTTTMELHSKERAVHSTPKDSTVHDSSTARQTETQDTPEEPGSGPGCICVCGESDESTMRRTKCGAAMCSTCLDTVHVHCKVCRETEPRPKPRGVQGKMTHCKLHISVPGYKKDSAIKITYCIPDGVQGEGHPSPGKPFQGGVFEAFLPDCETARRLLPRLDKAFGRGLTFTVVEREAGARATWDGIPHKTSLHGGKSGNGYPDSTYLTRLSEVLTSHGIKEPPAKSAE